MLDARAGRRSSSTCRCSSRRGAPRATSARSAPAAASSRPATCIELMRVVYPGAFLAMLVEGARSRQPAAGVLRRAARSCSRRPRRSNGGRSSRSGPSGPSASSSCPARRWSRRGPYRWLRHPNYVGVLGELAGVAAMAGAPIAGVVATGRVRGAAGQADRRRGAGAPRAGPDGPLTRVRRLKARRARSVPLLV